jgi:phosphoribosyl-AMP cyclohydrolase
MSTTMNLATHTTNTDWLDTVRFDDKGLIPAIAQDHLTGKVLMFAWMNREAIYFSRSRNKLWHKGEESGHTQIVKSIRIDCDGDVVLLAVEQLHGIACHTGREACFFYELNDHHQWCIVEPVIKNPETIYTHAA